MASKISEVEERTLGNRVEQELSPIDTQRTALTKSRYDRQAKVYEKKAVMMERLAFGKLRHKLWSMVSGPEVLEVGIGTGLNMPFYSKDVNVTGIDLSDQMIAQARERAERDGVAVQLLEMDAQDLRFPANIFDCAVTTCVFCSVPDPVRGLEEIRRVLKPGGRLVMAEHVRGPGLLGPLFDLFNPIVFHFNGANINRRTVENVRRAGFEIENVESRFLGIVKLIDARKR